MQVSKSLFSFLSKKSASPFAFQRVLVNSTYQAFSGDKKPAGGDKKPATDKV